MRALLAVAALLLGAATLPAAETLDAKKAKAYLGEVKKHLLQSYIERDRVKEEMLHASAIRGMTSALDHKDFSSLDAETRRAVKEALKGKATVDEAVDAAHGAAPDLDLIRLADHGARAMIRQTGDPFSRILTQEDMMKLMRMIQDGGREATAGCAVQAQDGKASVFYVQYGTPAYEEGLRIGDEVLEIRGKKAGTLSSEEIDALLKLPMGETLEIKVRRYGKEYAFRLRQRKAEPQVVLPRYLGQGVGYLRITLFDLTLVRDARKALEGLKAQGMTSLILDLRHNPGGALPAATGVADLFLKQNLIIARTVSYYKPSIGGLRLPWLGIDPEYKTKARSDFEDVPMVCLIDGASASASELLAGALKDHGRAFLIGDKTYGKGLGQSAIILSSMGLQRYLYLSVMKYTTPHGHEVNHKGVQPDLAFREEPPPVEKFDAAWKLRESGKLERYLDAHWGAGLEKLADYDAFETAGYPEFEKFYAELGTSLARDDVRGELRRAARARMAAEGASWVTDLQTDLPLQRALAELLDRAGKKE